MEKRTLRENHRQQRAAISADEKKSLDRSICQRIARTPEFQKAETVLLYYPIKGEIDLLHLIPLCRKLGKEVGFPISMEDGTLTFRSPGRGEQLIPGAYGIPEPSASAKPSTLNEKTLCILPGLSFDEHGNRLGYGRGYYDRFLEHFSGMTLGAVYSAALAKELPTDANDRPVSVVVCEDRTIRCTQKTNRQATEIRERLSNALYNRLEPARRFIQSKLHPNEAPAAIKSDVRPRTGAPLLVLATYLLLVLSRFVDGALTRRDGVYIAVVLLQLLIFMLPATLYLQIRGEQFSKRIRIRPIRPQHLWFCFCMLAVMILSGLLISIIGGGISSLSGNFTLYNTFVARTGGSAWEIAYIILAYAALPAFCEELVYRSILCAEYEKLGTGVSILVSALFFSMLHFSFPFFVNYLVLGILLAFVMYTTRSVLAPMLLHFLYNVFCLFGQPYLSAFYVNAGSNEIFLFCLIGLLLLFSAFSAGEARKIYHLYARANLSSDYTTAVTPSEYPIRIFTALKTPFVIPVVLLWLVMAIIDLFV